MTPTMILVPEAVFDGVQLQRGWAVVVTGDRIVAIVSVNAPRDLRAAKKLVLTRKAVRPESLADPAVQLQRL